MNNTGSVVDADCIPCLIGFYCSGVGNTEPTGPCDAGYYCEVGETIASPPSNTCSLGKLSHYLEEGAYC